jgi:hypothetical protein
VASGPVTACRFSVPDQRAEAVGHHAGLPLVVRRAQRLVTAPEVRFGVSEHELPGQQIRPPAHIGRGPVELLELGDGAVTQAQRAVAGLALCQCRQLARVQGEVAEVVDGRR